MNEDIYDFIAIGIGPFNLSLAGLTAPLRGVRAVFLDKRSGFDWHPGMLIDACSLQNPFLADLVSLADPRSEYSYLNYCKTIGRIYSYYMRENHYLSRHEYNRYCQWVAARLPNVRFSHDVQSITYEHERGCYLTSGTHASTGKCFSLRAKKLVLGVGTQPVLPDFCHEFQPTCLHSSEYIKHKRALQSKKSITIVGSGQSAAEIFYDLLRESHQYQYTLFWITRSSRFFQMENTKLTLELISPDYTEYFFDLSEEQKRKIIKSQNSLYKGINANLINEIYDMLDEKIYSGERRYVLQTNSDLRSCQYNGDQYRLVFHHLEYDVPFQHVTEGLVLATGYAPRIPLFINPIRDRIAWTSDGEYRVGRNYTIDHKGTEIFVQNTGLFSHGVSNPDLGFSCYRNSQILFDITGQEHYMIEPHTAIQSFRPPLDGILKDPRSLNAINLPKNIHLEDDA